MNWNELTDQAGDKLSWRTFRFVSKEDEQDFLDSKLRQDVRIAQFLMLALTLTLLSVLPFDKMIVKPEYWPTVAVSARVSLFFMCLILIYALNRIQTVRQFSVLTVFAVFILLSNIQGMVIAFKDYYILHVFFDIIIMFAIYFSMLLTFYAATVVCILYSLISYFVIYYTKTVDAHTLIVLQLTYFSVNITGAVVAMQQNIFRRLYFHHNRRLEELSKSLKKQASTDVLTGLHNRRSFEQTYNNYLEAVSRSEKTEEKLYLAIADIDHFKQVNDTYGHDVGDIVLKKFADFLMQSVRPTDGVYRFGGEEFIIVFVYCSKLNVIKRINEIIHSLNEKVLGIEQFEHPVTASFGLTKIGLNEPSRVVIERADKALYAAKHNGRNQIIFETSPHDPS